MVGTPELTVNDCTIMLKACYTAKQQQELIEVTMAKAGVAPNVVTYTTLVNGLMIEGNVEGARCVVEKDMPAAGVQPNDETHKALNLPYTGHDLNRMRQTKLGNWLKQGGDEATNAAWTLLGIGGC